MTGLQTFGPPHVHLTLMPLQKLCSVPQSSSPCEARHSRASRSLSSSSRWNEESSVHLTNRFESRQNTGSWSLHHMWFEYNFLFHQLILLQDEGATFALFEATSQLRIGAGVVIYLDLNSCSAAGYGDLL